MKVNAAIDNDFLLRLLKITGNDDLYGFIVSFFDTMKVIPEMHYLVYHKEYVLMQNNLSKQFFDNGIVRISDFEKITSDPIKKRLYEMQVKYIYQKITGEQYPCKDICNNWISRKSLGEIHTVVFCVLVGIDCFLSDDKGSKHLSKIVDDSVSEPIKVWNREDCCEHIRRLPKGTHPFNRKDLRALSHTQP